MTLVEFLLARIAEDEAAARSGDEEGRVTNPWALWIHYDGQYLCVHSSRALAECEAKRRIVEWCGVRDMIWTGTLMDNPESPRPSDFVPGHLKHPGDAVVLRFLALPYAGHEDYRDEWKP